TREIWPAKDGYVTFALRGGPGRIPNLIATVEYMKECAFAPAWLAHYDWKSYDHTRLSDEEIARLEAAFAAFFRTQTMRQLYQEALRRRILLAPCNDVHAVLEQPQLRSRELFVTIEYPHLGAAIEVPDFFARTADHAVAIRRRAPRIGEHNQEIWSDL